MYDRLAPWYPLLDPLADHEDEADLYTHHLRRLLGDRPSPTLLELGSGRGNNAWWMKRHFAEVALVDPSEAMRALSQALNPDCAHHAGDFATTRLGRTFDAVFVHDAIVYLRTVAELAEGLATVAAHLAPGGVALLAPDAIQEIFAESCELFEGVDGDRALKVLEWSWDPDPTDQLTRCEYVFTCRQGDQVEVVHDVHLEGLFPRATWTRLLAQAGFVGIEAVPWTLDGDRGELFVAVRSPR